MHFKILIFSLLSLFVFCGTTHAQNVLNSNNDYAIRVSRPQSFPPHIYLYGIYLNMDKQNIGEYLSNKGLHQVTEANSIYNLCRYVGDNIKLYGINFDNIDIYYNNDQRAEWIVFKTFVPKENGTQEKIFRKLYNELYRKTSWCRWEGFDNSYLFAIKNKYSIAYIRIFVDEVLQGTIGYNVILTCGYNAEKIVVE